MRKVILTIDIDNFQTENSKNSMISAAQRWGADFLSYNHKILENSYGITFTKSYIEQIPYYNARHLIKPGLSGWAQIYHENHPHHGIDIEETKNKLSYDLFYVKNRSLILDLEIALKTIKTLISQTGK
jgi:hypothetical protein